MKTLLLFLFAFQCVTAKIEWPIYIDQSGIMRLADIKIGTPPQPIVPYMIINANCSGLYMPKWGEKHPNGFAMEYSSTFHNQKTVENSALGTDDFQIPDRHGVIQKIEQKSFNVVIKDGKCSTDFPHLTFTSSPDLPNYFLNSVFDDSDEAVAVISIDSTSGPTIEKFNYVNGTLTLGERPSNCNSKWTMAPVSKNQTYAQWSLDVDKITLGKFAAHTPGVAVIDSYYGYFEMPQDIYEEIANLLDVNQKVIPCDSSEDIVLTISGYDIRITPDNYLIPSNDGLCYFAANPSPKNSAYFTFPFSAIVNQCLLFDFKKNQVGFTNKKN